MRINYQLKGQVLFATGRVDYRKLEQIRYKLIQIEERLDKIALNSEIPDIDRGKAIARSALVGELVGEISHNIGMLKKVEDDERVQEILKGN